MNTTKKSNIAASMITASSELLLSGLLLGFALMGIGTVVQQSSAYQQLGTDLHSTLSAVETDLQQSLLAKPDHSKFSEAHRKVDEWLKAVSGVFGMLTTLAVVFGVIGLIFGGTGICKMKKLYGQMMGGSPATQAESAHGGA